MKKLFSILILIHFISLSYSQDILTFKNGKEISVNVDRITTDSVYYSHAGIVNGSLITDVQKVNSRDKFKTFMLSAESRRNGNLSYTNYCLIKYGNQATTGKMFTLVGVGVTTYSFIKLKNLTDKEDVSTNDIKKAYTMGIIGGGITLLGILIDMSANHWLKNISVAPEYKVGMGFKFKF